MTRLTTCTFVVSLLAATSCGEIENHNPGAIDAIGAIDAMPDVIDAMPDAPDTAVPPAAPSISHVWKLMTLAPVQGNLISADFTTTADDDRRVLFLLSGTARPLQIPGNPDGALVGELKIIVKLDGAELATCRGWGSQNKVTTAIPACSFYARPAPGLHTISISGQPGAGTTVPVTGLNANDRFDLVALELAPEVELTDLDGGDWVGPSHTGTFKTAGRPGLLLASMAAWRPAAAAAVLAGAITMAPQGEPLQPLVPSEEVQALARFTDAGAVDQNKHLAFMPVALPLTRAQGTYDISIGAAPGTSSGVADPIDGLWFEPGDDVSMLAFSKNGGGTVEFPALPGHHGSVLLLVTATVKTAGVQLADVLLKVDTAERGHLGVHSHARRALFGRTAFVLDAPANDFPVSLTAAPAFAASDKVYVTAIYLPEETIVEDVSVPPL
jgi:hypothetical protein